MSNYIIAIRREHLKTEEIYGEAPTENLAISRADRLYDKFILDSVAVVEIDKEIITVPYKRTRKCKHTNIQYVLSSSGAISPTCESCNNKMAVEAMGLSVGETQGLPSGSSQGVSPSVIL